MTETMDDKYLRLGRLIAAQCPPGFREARLEGAVDTDWGALALSWTTQDQVRQEAAPIMPMTEIHLALDDVREAMAGQSGDERWRSFLVTLRQGGHFQLDVAH